MMRIFLLVAIFIAGYLLGGVVDLKWNNAAHITEYNPTLSNTDEISALRGDHKASTALSMSYEKCLSKNIDRPKDYLRCANALKYWSRIDAENGSSYGVASIYHELAQKNDCISLNRALFWIKRAYDLGLTGVEWTEELRRLELRIRACK